MCTMPVPSSVGYKIAKNYAEGIPVIYLHKKEAAARTLCLRGRLLLLRLSLRKGCSYHPPCNRPAFSSASSCLKYLPIKIFCKNYGACSMGMRAVCFNQCIIDLVAYGPARWCWKGKRPGGWWSMPGKRYRCRLSHASSAIKDNGALIIDFSILNMATAVMSFTSLYVPGWFSSCELRPCSGSGRVRLDGIAFVQQPFVIKLFQRPPEALDVFGFVGNVRNRSGSPNSPSVR